MLSTPPPPPPGASAATAPPPPPPVDEIEEVAIAAPPPPPPIEEELPKKEEEEVSGPVSKPASPYALQYKWGTDETGDPVEIAAPEITTVGDEPLEKDEPFEKAPVIESERPVSGFAPTDTSEVLHQELRDTTPAAESVTVTEPIEALEDKILESQAASEATVGQIIKEVPGEFEKRFEGKTAEQLTGEDVSALIEARKTEKEFEKTEVESKSSALLKDYLKQY